MHATSSLWTWLTNAWAKTSVRQTLFVASLFLIIGGTQSYLFKWATHQAGDWVVNLDVRSNMCDEAQKCFGPAVPITEWERSRIDAQYRQTCGRAKHHLDVMINMYSNYYVFIVMASLAAVVAGIAIFLVGKTGWANASTSGLVLVITMTSAALLYRSLPAIFQQEQNIAENKRLYLDYVALENETRSFSATGEDVQGKKQTASQFIHYLDDRLASLNNIALGFDPSKVPSTKDVETLGRDQRR